MGWIVGIGIWLVVATLILLFNYGAHKNDPPDDDWE